MEFQAQTGSFSEVTGIFFAAMLVGCEKITTPFSANAAQPSASQINVNVLQGTSPKSNVIVKAIDPSGNIFTTISDSNGIAVFNPIPFNVGNWRIETPEQSNRCPNPSTQTVTILSGSKSVSVQYAVYTNFSVNASSTTVLNASLGEIQINEVFSLLTQNDCGIQWTVTFSFKGSGFVWTVGGSGGLSPGQSYSVNLSSGQSIGFSIIEFPYSTFSSIQIGISSPIGSTNNSSMIF